MSLVVDHTLVETALDTLKTLREELERLQAEKREAMPARVQDALARLDEKFNPRIDVVRNRVTETEEQIRHAILEFHHSVQGRWLQAVYMSPRKTCDIKKLEGYAAAHPEVAAFIKVGEPSVQIREIVRKLMAGAK
jgi:hypothetical protein